jgi:hypothetical protein
MGACSSTGKLDVAIPHDIVEHTMSVEEVLRLHGTTPNGLSPQQAAERLQLHPIARPFAAGGLFSLYALPYLAQGTSQQWWAYAPAAAGGPLPLKGAPMWTFAGGWGSTALAPSASTAALLSFR